MTSIPVPVRGRRSGLRLPSVSPIRLLLMLALLLASAGAGYFGYSRYLEQQRPARVTGQPATVQRGSIAATVNATGNVAPLNQAKVSLRTAGLVTEVLVKPGDAVTKDQPLLRIDAGDLELAVRAQELAVRNAEVKLAQIQAGSRPEDVASSQAALQSAQAKLSAVRAGPLASDVQSAQSAVVTAQANLDKAQNDLAKLTAPPTSEELAPSSAALEKARGALVKAQSDYDRIAWRGNVGATTEAATLASATADYQQALAAYNQARQGPNQNDVDSAQQAVVSAKATLASAQAKLDQVNAGAAPEDLAAAQAAVTQAASALALKQNPYTQDDITAAEIAVDQAKIQLAVAERNLDSAELRAPFDGTVSAVNVAPGELASSGGNGAVVLVDPSTVRIDTTVDESDIGKLKVGQRAQIQFEAIPGKTFAATVSAIAPTASVQSGVATYTVSLSIQNPQGVLPGMTATANIVYDQKSNILVVPNRAIRTVGRNRVVDVLQADGTTREQSIQAGTSNDQLTEIVNGLNEGDQVLIRSTTTRAGGFGPGGLPGAGPGGGPVIIGGPRGG